MNQHSILDIVVYVSFLSGVAHSFLPPYELFGDWPGFQKKYKLFILLVGSLGMNFRGKMLQQYQSKAPEIMASIATDTAHKLKAIQEKNGGERPNGGK